MRCATRELRPKLIKADCLHPQREVLRKLGVGRAPPEAESFVQMRQLRPRSLSRSGVFDQVLENGDVDLLVDQGQSVTRRLSLECSREADLVEHLAKSTKAAV
jgi:hypothetical protein